MSCPTLHDLLRVTAGLAVGGATMMSFADAAAAQTPEVPAAARAVAPSGQALADDGYAKLRAGELEAALKSFTAALDSHSLTAEQAVAVRLTTSDVLVRLNQPKLAADLLASSAMPQTYEVHARRAFALDAAGDRGQAAAAYAAAYPLAPTPADARLMAMGRLYALAALDRGPEALTQARALESDAGLSSTQTMEAAAIAARFGDDRLAQRLYARSQGALTGTAALDAGFSARRVGDDAAALRYFKIGLADAVRPDAPREAQQLRYGIRREVADLSRRWGVIASAFYEDGDAASGRLPGAGLGSFQVGGEAYYRPLGYNGGRTVEIFARAFVTLAAQGGDAEGGETAQGYVGARVKPLASQNLVLEGARLVKLGSAAQSDWMVRGAYSWTDGLDLKAARTSWPLVHVFGDVAHLIDADATFGLAEGRVGRSFRTAESRLILAPFASVQFAYDSGLPRETALGAGAGLWLRRWFRETTYAAPQSYVDLTMQYRFRVAGDRRAEGFFASFSVSY